MQGFCRGCDRTIDSTTNMLMIVNIIMIVSARKRSALVLINYIIWELQILMKTQISTSARKNEPYAKFCRYMYSTENYTVFAKFTSTRIFCYTHIAKFTSREIIYVNSIVSINFISNMEVLIMDDDIDIKVNRYQKMRILCLHI